MSLAVRQSIRCCGKAVMHLHQPSPAASTPPFLSATRSLLSGDSDFWVVRKADFVDQDREESALWRRRSRCGHAASDACSLIAGIRSNMPTCYAAAWISAIAASGTFFDPTHDHSLSNAMGAHSTKALVATVCWIAAMPVVLRVGRIIGTIAESVRMYRRAIRDV
jgi:hypothetical protein